MEKVSNLDSLTRQNLIAETAGFLLAGSPWELEGRGWRWLATMRPDWVEVDGDDALLLQRRFRTGGFLTRMTTDSFSLLKPVTLAETGLQRLSGHMYLPYRDSLFVGSAEVPESGWRDMQLQWHPISDNSEMDEFWRRLSSADLPRF